ncbi:MAG TPA: antibiotic biosynthesis monooxygenase [Thermoanaerobaculia bacterium]|jgi:heme-degrading monooxygenase HmoA
MIMRVWHGYTSPENADAYEELLKTEVLPGIHRVKGYCGAFLLRKEKEDEVEFITLTTWDSLAAIEEFAGHDHTHAVVPPKARKLLSRFDEASEHYAAQWVK